MRTHKREHTRGWGGGGVGSMLPRENFKFKSSEIKSSAINGSLLYVLTLSSQPKIW